MEKIDKGDHLSKDGAMKKQHVQVTKREREYLENLVSKGELRAKVKKGAIGLMELDRGNPITVVAESLNVSHTAVRNW